MLQDGVDELLHLADINIRTTAGSLPSGPSFERDRITAWSVLAAEEDLALINQVPPSEIQDWCLARIAGHRDHNRLLRELHGPAAGTAVCKTKSHIRALRSEYNVFAPINRLLPPEVLMEIFSNIHPAVVYRCRVPVLHVCRYWTMIILKVPQFWANLASLQMPRSMNPKWRRDRLTTALALSAPLSLDLSLTFWSSHIIDIVVLHAARLASLTIRPVSDIISIKRLLEQHMPHLRDLVILDRLPHWIDLPLTLCFHQYPNIQSFRLQHSLYYSSTAPCPSLRHLKLTRCTMRPWPICGYVPSMRAVHDALELFPNLETLTLDHSLSEGDFGGELPQLAKIIHLPRLVRLEIEDAPVYIPYFLSHLVLPPTTALVLATDYRLTSEHPVPAPVFPGMTPSPAPGAELSLDLDFSYNFNGHQPPEGLARWETHGSGARPVCVTLTRGARRLDTIAHFTRELAHTLARPPGRGMASLTVTGSWARSLGEGHAALNLRSAREYWAAFLPDLAGLRRLTCIGQGATKDLLDVLGQRLLPQGPGGGSEEFVCPRLAELALVWDVPTTACFEMERDGQQSGGARGGENSNPGSDSGDKEGSWSASSTHGAGCPSQVEVGVGPAFAAALGELCDALAACLAGREGRCEPIRTLSVAPRGMFGWDLCLESWQAALVERRLRNRLGQLMGEVLVVDKVE